MTDDLNKAGRVKTGRFASIKQLHGEATDEHTKHSALAEEAEKDADRHQRKVDAAVGEKNAEAVKMHSDMAHLSSTSATHHKEIASRYKDIASRLVPEGSED